MISEERKGDWITTYTGKSFWPLSPSVEDVNINDIAHSLSNLCRFNGHCVNFYSVAQHSVLISTLVPEQDALWGLLHDASESYLCDIPSPLKKLPEFEAYRQAETRVMNVICDAFGLARDEPSSIKIADRRMLVTEARDLTFTEGRGWLMKVEPYEFHIKAWTPEQSRIKFLARFHELFFAPQLHSKELK